MLHNCNIRLQGSSLIVLPQENPIQWYLGHYHREESKRLYRKERSQARSSSGPVLAGKADQVASGLAEMDPLVVIQSLCDSKARPITT